MPETKIRPATLDDLPALSGLFELLMRGQMAYDRLAEIFPEADFEKLVRGFLSAGNNKILLALRGESAIGFIRLNIYSGTGIKRLQSPSRNTLLERLGPRRVARKILGSLLARLEPPLAPPSIFKPQRTGYIADLFVEEQNRKAGAGSELVRQALNWFGENQIELVYLQVLSENRAGVEFWQKQGFSGYRMLMRKKLPG